MALPAATGSGVAVLVSNRLARSVTGVSVCTVPGVVLVGGVADVTDASLPMDPVAALATVTGIRMISLPFTATVVAVQLTVCPVTVQVPIFGLGDPTVSRGSRVSVTTTC